MCVFRRRCSRKRRKDLVRRLAAVIGSQRRGTPSGEEASGIYDGYFFHCRMADTNKDLGRTKKGLVFGCLGCLWRNLAEFGGKGAGPKKAAVQPVVISPFAGSVADEEATAGSEASSLHRRRVVDRVYIRPPLSREQTSKQTAPRNFPLPPCYTAYPASSIVVNHHHYVLLHYRYCRQHPGSSLSQ